MAGKKVAGLLTILAVLVGWGLHKVDTAIRDREAFAQSVTDASVETDEDGNEWGHTYLATGLLSQNLSLIAPDSDGVACDGYLSAVLHEAESQRARDALLKHGFNRISCGNRTVTLSRSDKKEPLPSSFTRQERPLVEKRKRIS